MKLKTIAKVESGRVNKVSLQRSANCENVGENNDQSNHLKTVLMVLEFFILLKIFILSMKVLKLEASSWISQRHLIKVA